MGEMAAGRASEPAGATGRPWWETRPFVAVLILLSIVPLIYPPIPPLVDLLGHMGRYRVELDLATSPWLQRYWGFRWSPIGNLGIDIAILPLAKLFGLEAAVKLLVMAIPPLTVAGFLWVAREVHHRLPPTALFALPFAYCHPFMFGFANYALSMAFAFLAFGLWLHLARRDRLALRAALFVPISVVVYFTHTFGWGVLGLLCFSAEAVRQHDRGTGWLRSGINAAMHAAVMLLPVVFILAWRSGIQHGVTGRWFDAKLKLLFLLWSLRDRWQWFDAASLVLALAVIVLARLLKVLTFSRNLVFSALVLFAGFLIIPYVVFSSAYADMRLIPYVVAVLLLAIRFRGEMPRRTATILAVAGLAFYVVRIAGNTASLAIAANDQNAKLEALDHVPMGARVVSFVGNGCGNPWPLPRNTHLPAMVIVRRHGFSNDQWVTEGINLLTLKYKGSGHFSADPSQIIRQAKCEKMYWDQQRAFDAIPRDGFDYLWLIDMPPVDPRNLSGMEIVWSGSGSKLYRIRPAS